MGETKEPKQQVSAEMEEPFYPSGFTFNFDVLARILNQPRNSPEFSAIETVLTTNLVSSFNEVTQPPSLHAKDLEMKGKAKDTMPKSKWLAYALRCHPDVLEMRERMVPILKEPSFSALPHPAHTENRHSLPYRQTLQLIMGYLHKANLTKTVQTLEEETETPFLKDFLGENALTSLLRLGVKDTKALFAQEENEKSGVPKDDDVDAEVEVADHPDKIMSEAYDKISNNIGESNRLWNENENIQRTASGMLVAATLSGFVLHITGDSFNESSKLIEVLLLTYPCMANSDVFLRTLLERYPRTTAKSKKDIQILKKSQDYKVQNRVFTILRTWLTEFFTDFSEKQLDTITNFAGTTMTTAGHISHARELRNAITHLMSIQDKDERTALRTRPPEPKVNQKTIFSRQLSLVDVDEEELARQLTLITFGIFQKIQRWEILGRAWTKGRSQANVNILRMLKLHDDVAVWVAQSILTASSAKKRAKMINRFIRLAEVLRHLNNFATCAAVVAGLSKPCISRLRSSWDETSKRAVDTYTELLRIFSGHDDHQLYLSLISSALLPTIPHMIVHARMLSMIEESCEHVESDFDSNITQPSNTCKTSMLTELADIIRIIRRSQKVPYQLLPVHQITVLVQEFRKDLTNTTEEELNEISLSLEGP
eukprot:GCRY01004009.1.p1 GENE.GCRY01004009.1~~GCRY01004009.1.p1  ORF type:complete len:655 (+),score=159.76 GCRY01004009.1:165-2129(+)